MPTVEFMGKTFSVDEDGFIDTYENWCQEWVQHVKKEEGIEELTEEHTKVIQVLQEYYEKNGIAPMVRVLSKVTGFKFRLDPAREPVKWPVSRSRLDVSNQRIVTVKQF
jgi:tRNA 2-thiouridine synthesizing protein E